MIPQRFRYAMFLICLAGSTAPTINLLMSTLTATGIPASRRSAGWRMRLWLLALILLLILGLPAYAYFAARSALPQMDGNLAVKGLSASVKITRNQPGVPAIQG